MTLTKEDIQFIDNYLKYDIDYIDIRTEIIDHVASEIEEKMKAGDNRGFYFIFKDYMVKNKARLINEDKKFKKLADKKVLRVLGTNMRRPFSLFVFIVSAILFYIINNYDTVISKSILTSIPMYCYSIVIISLFLFTIRIRKKQYSSFVRLSFYIMTLLMITQILFFGNDNILEKWMHIENMNIFAILINSLYTSITAIFIYTMIQFRKEYNNRYRKIA